MPKRIEDIFIDDVVAYQEYLGQGEHWPHFDGGEIIPEPIDGMSPQHAVSALHKSWRWLDWLWKYDRFSFAGIGSGWDELCRQHADSDLVHALAVQAVGPAVWDSAHPPKEVLRDFSPERITDIAVNTLFAWQDLGIRATPAGRLKALREILTRNLAGGEET